MGESAAAEALAGIRYCKKCKKVFAGTSCGSGHANFMFLKKIPPAEEENAMALARTVAAGGGGGGGPGPQHDGDAKPKEKKKAAGNPAFSAAKDEEEKEKEKKTEKKAKKMKVKQPPALVMKTKAELSLMSKEERVAYKKQVAAGRLAERKRLQERKAEAAKTGPSVCRHPAPTIPLWYPGLQPV